LPETSLIRAHKLFTIEQSRIVKKFSVLGKKKLRDTLLLLRKLFDNPALDDSDDRDSHDAPGTKSRTQPPKE
jgi:hypothetical protein